MCVPPAHRDVCAAGIDDEDSPLTRLGQGAMGEVWAAEQQIVSFTFEPPTSMTRIFKVDSRLFVDRALEVATSLIAHR